MLQIVSLGFMLVCITYEGKCYIMVIFLCSNACMHDIPAYLVSKCGSYIWLASYI